MKNFYLIYGLDKSLIKNEIEKIKKELKASEIIKYSLEKDNLEDIILDASLVNMFAEKKVILVSDALIFASGKKEENVNALENYLNNFNSDTYIIFECPTEKIDTRKKITKKLSEIGTIIETKKKDASYVKQYITDILKENNYTIESLEYLMSKVGTNVDNVKNELDKLMIFKMEDKIITNTDIDKLMIPALEDEIFALTDAVVKSDVKRSLELLEEFLNKSYDEMQIIILLASQFRFMYQVKRLANKNMKENAITKELSANPYRVKITLKNSYYYNETNLLSYLKKLADLDKNIKLNNIDKNLELQLFLMNKDYKKNDKKFKLIIF